MEQAKAQVPDHDAKWDEFDHEKFMRESDARTDKYMQLIEKYGDSPEAEEIIAREMGWDVGRVDEDDDEDETTGRDIPDLSDIPDPVPSPLTAGVDWVRDEGGHIHHPLQKRCFEEAMALSHAVDELDLKDDDEDVAEMTFKFQQTSAKLAGALNSLGYDGRRSSDQGPATVARLKRALNHRHECQAAMVPVKEMRAVPAEIIATAEAELFAVREEILRLMAKFREIWHLTTRPLRSCASIPIVDGEVANWRSRSVAPRPHGFFCNLVGTFQPRRCFLEFSYETGCSQGRSSGEASRAARPVSGNERVAISYQGL